MSSSGPFLFWAKHFHISQNKDSSKWFLKSRLVQRVLYLSHLWHSSQIQNHSSQVPFAWMYSGLYCCLFTYVLCVFVYPYFCICVIGQSGWRQLGGNQCIISRRRTVINQKSGNLHIWPILFELCPKKQTQIISAPQCVVAAKWWKSFLQCNAVFW